MNDVTDLDNIYPPVTRKCNRKSQPTFVRYTSVNVTPPAYRRQNDILGVDAVRSWGLTKAQETCNVCNVIVVSSCSGFELYVLSKAVDSTDDENVREKILIHC